MKITQLTIENFKKISVVQITPDGNMVQITGKNAQGKTSVLDSITAALEGQSAICWRPVRKGEKQARITLAMGEYIVTRTFKYHDDTGETTTQLRVERDGFNAPSPQKMLDGFLDSLSFDPLAFTRMKPREQFEALRSFVPGVDFDAIDAANKADFAKRAEVNRDAKQARAVAAQIVVPDGLPAEPIDDLALLADMQRTAQHNADLDREVDRRTLESTTLGKLKDEIAAGVDTSGYRAAVAAERDRQLEDIQRQIAALNARADEVANEAMRRMDEIESAAVAKLDRLTSELATRQADFEALPSLPDRLDADAIRRQIEGARAMNAAIQQRDLRDRQIANAEALEAQSDALTKAMEARTADKQAKVAAAKLPVAGITFGDGAILLDGLPLDQASDARQLRTSIAIAMARQPKLRVFRVRDGSLLDEDGLRLLAGLADEHNCQVWVERVDSTGAVGFVLEDGHLKEPAPPAAGQGDLLGGAA